MVEIIQTLPPVSGESVDTPKKFTNIDTEDFEFSWDNIKTIVLVGETKDLPKYKVNYAAMHLARKIVKREKNAAFEGTELEKAKSWTHKVRDEGREAELRNEMVSVNFKEIAGDKPEEQAKGITEGEPVKIEEDLNLLNLTCKICGFVAKSKFGLQSHKKKHKK